MRKLLIGLLLIGLAALPTAAQAQVSVGAAVLNSQATASGAATVSIAAVSGQRVRLYTVGAYCSAGTSQLQVKDGVSGTIIWSTPTAAVGTGLYTAVYTPVPLVSSVGNGMDVVLLACTAGGSAAVQVQAERVIQP